MPDCLFEWERDWKRRNIELSIILISRERKLLLLILFAYDDSFVILIRARFTRIYEREKGRE